MGRLITTRNLAEHDAFYARLLAAHKGLSDAESQALNARLILILANHIGDPEALAEALALAAERPDTG
jgi:hypothetical protein